jgi:glycosyltransferase involved in cell wall biosynthesis
MHLLFIHQAFPAQFGRVALELVKRHGWRCSFLVEDLSSCPMPTREMLERLDIRRIPLPVSSSQPETPWPQIYGRWLELCQAVFESVRGQLDLRPDLVVGHGGRGPLTLLLREVLDCPIVNYCEYYFAARRRDISYRIDLPPAEPAECFPRSINAPTLAALVDADAGYSPTEWQRASFPRRFHSKIEVHFDGIDTELYRRRVVPRVLAGRPLAPDQQVVTFVARGLESMRGFDLFLRVADRIARERPNVLFAVVGTEEIYYGWDKLHTGQPSFKQWAMAQGNYDLSRFVFLGHQPPDALADILSLSDLHLYLTVPFVLSWSVLNAMATGCVVLASDVGPVREVIEPGRNGLVEPLFDLDRLAETALRVLADPGAYQPLGRAARECIESKYSVDASIPGLHDFYERVATGRHSDSAPSGVRKDQWIVR